MPCHVAVGVPIRWPLLEVVPRPRQYGAYGGSYLAERRSIVRRALRVHPLSTYLVFQALTAVLSLAYAGVWSVNSNWSHWLGVWATLALVGLVWTQVVWGPCWEAGADYGLSAGVRIVLMAVSGGALLLPFLALHLVVGGVWFFFAVVLIPYGFVSGLVGGAVLAIRDRGAIIASRAVDARDVAPH